jgi:putative transcriptional regulator
MHQQKMRGPSFARLKRGLEEAIQFEKGELTLRTVTAPERPPAMSALEIVALRKRVDMSQSVLASVLNVSPKTVQSWEQGTRAPAHSALRLLQILNAHPDLVGEIVGLPSAPGEPRRKSQGIRVSRAKPKPTSRS